jgi:hypothetical protein
VSRERSSRRAIFFLFITTKRLERLRQEARPFFGGPRPRLAVRCHECVCRTSGPDMIALLPGSRASTSGGVFSNWPTRDSTFPLDPDQSCGKATQPRRSVGDCVRGHRDQQPSAVTCRRLLSLKTLRTWTQCMSLDRFLNTPLVRRFAADCCQGRSKSFPRRRGEREPLEWLERKGPVDEVARPQTISLSCVRVRAKPMNILVDKPTLSFKAGLDSNQEAD